MGYTVAGYYNVAPEFINFSGVGMQALKGLADSMGMSVGDLQSQMQNYSRFINSLYGSADAPGGGGGGDWFSQWDGSKTTMKDWIDEHGGMEDQVLEPADRLYKYWTQDSLKTLEDSVMGDPTAMIGGGDAAPGSRVFDQMNMARFKQQAAGLQDANRRGSTEPWLQGVYQGYSNHLNQGANRAQLAAQMMQGYFGQLMNPYNTILQANAGGYGGGMVREMSQPTNMMGMSAGMGGGGAAEEDTGKDDAIRRAYEEFLRKQQGGVGTPSTSGTNTINPDTADTTRRSWTAPPDISKGGSGSWGGNQGGTLPYPTKKSNSSGGGADFSKGSSTNGVTR